MNINFKIDSLNDQLGDQISQFIYNGEFIQGNYCVKGIFVIPDTQVIANFNITVPFLKNGLTDSFAIEAVVTLPPFMDLEDQDGLIWSEDMLSMLLIKCLHDCEFDKDFTVFKAVNEQIKLISADA